MYTFFDIVGLCCMIEVVLIVMLMCLTIWIVTIMGIKMKPEFEVGSLVVHKKGGIYIISKLPDKKKKLEYCNEPYYSYFDSDGVEWERRASEFEDGRMVLVDPEHELFVRNVPKLTRWEAAKKLC